MTSFVVELRRLKRHRLFVSRHPKTKAIKDGKFDCILKLVAMFKHSLPRRFGRHFGASVWSLDFGNSVELWLEGTD